MEMKLQGQFIGYKIKKKYFKPLPVKEGAFFLLSFLVFVWWLNIFSYFWVKILAKYLTITQITNQWKLHN